ncbi:MAG: inositol-3-phosphate synthase, partial [Nitrospinae bacterium]|nr:inositol-3-phosphate synthase [Nitrospinota bacterium]
MNEAGDSYSGMAKEIVPSKGKLGVLLPGMGAVSSTLIAGVFLVNSGHAKPIGS